MKFPRSTHRVKNFTLILELSIQDSSDDLCFYTRKYFSVNYIDGLNRIYFTTDEFDENYMHRILDEDFILILNLECFFKSFENTTFSDTVIGNSNNQLPNYIFYTLIFIHPAFKPLVLKQLLKNVVIVSKMKLNDLELNLLNRWFSVLKSK